MTDYFALLGEARRAWLDPEKLKEKYFALNRATAADAELNEAYRVLSDPKLRLHHLLTLDGAELTASRQVPPTSSGPGPPGVRSRPNQVALTVVLKAHNDS